jgi:cellobiose-specific phosphotransferase system component IIC
VVTYSSFDVEFIDYTTAASPMPTKAIANTLTALVVVAEALLFVWWFGLTGLWVFIASTVVYSLFDARTRRWLKGLLKNKSAGSGGSA